MTQAEQFSSPACAAQNAADRFPSDPLASGPHVIDEALAGKRLDQAISELIPALSRTRLKQLIEQGCLQVNGAIVDKPKQKVTLGQKITLDMPETQTSSHLAASNIKLDIVYEDKDLLVVHKPAGMVVHPAPGHYDDTLVNALLFHCGESLTGIGGEKRPGIVHRLDKDTSGLMVVAKSERAMLGLQKQFHTRHIERAYDAFVWGTPPSSGKIEKALGRSAYNRQKMAVVDEERGKYALTHYNRLASLGLSAAWIECRLATGRTHQIRVHMAEIGYPLIGDPLYGKAPPPRRRAFNDAQNASITLFSRQALHARLLGFYHPVTQEWLRFERPCPTDMQNLAAELSRLNFETLHKIISDFLDVTQKKAEQKRRREEAEQATFLAHLEQES